MEGAFNTAMAWSCLVDQAVIHRSTGAGAVLLQRPMPPRRWCRLRGTLVCGVSKRLSPLSPLRCGSYLVSRCWVLSLSRLAEGDQSRPRKKVSVSITALVVDHGVLFPPEEPF
jgi:hypothetical protein